jgi:hypothetical protein
MRRRLLAFSLLCTASVVACAPQQTTPYSGKARFADYPATLFAAFQTACTGPAQSFSRPSPDRVECREYLPPEPTAAIILSFDGTPEDLPQLVIRFTTEAAGDGFLVQNDVFLNVPQKSGAPLAVRRQDPRLERVLDALYRRSGGVPE